MTALSVLAGIGPLAWYHLHIAFRNGWDGAASPRETSAARTSRRQCSVVGESNRPRAARGCGREGTTATSARGLRLRADARGCNGSVRLELAQELGGHSRLARSSSSP